MRVVVTKSYEESCLYTAQMIADIVNAKPDAKLGLATGSTPLPIYKNLVAMNKEGKVDFAKVKTINLDEYCGLEGSHPQSYRYFMNQNLFDHINIDKANTYVANGLGNLEQNAVELENKVFEGGVPELQLLGIGSNGHIAFNEPGDFLVAPSHIESLTKATIDANSRFFENREDVPTTAVSMGMRGILAAKKIVLVASGAAKKDAIHGLLMENKVTTQNPSTFLKVHADVTIVIDQELADLAGYTSK